MADGIELNAGSGGVTLATDDDGTYHHQYVKMEFGADNTQTPVSSANPLPVDLGANNDVTLATLPDTAAGDLAAMVVDLAAIEVLAGTIDADTGNIATYTAGIDANMASALTSLQLIDDAVATEGEALGKGVLLQGDDGTDRTNVLVDTTGHLQVDVVSGTVDLGATDNAVLDSIATYTAGIDSNMASALTALQLLDNAIAGSEMQVDVITSALPTGAATAANQATIIGHVDGLEALLTTIDTDTGNVATSVATVAGAVSGTEMQVDVVAALPAGTNAIGKLAANSGVDIGDVDVTSIAAGTNVIGGVFSAMQTDYVYDGTSAATIKRATGLAASGTVAMVSAVVGKKIRVFALFLKATATTVTNVYVANDDNNILGDASNPIPLSIDASGDDDSGFVLNWNPGGWFETDTANEALNVVLSAAQDVIYAITYAEVD